MGIPSQNIHIWRKHVVYFKYIIILCVKSKTKQKKKLGFKKEQEEPQTKAAQHLNWLLSTNAGINELQITVFLTQLKVLGKMNQLELCAWLSARSCKTHNWHFYSNRPLMKRRNSPKSHSKIKNGSRLLGNQTITQQCLRYWLQSHNLDHEYWVSYSQLQYLHSMVPGGVLLFKTL